VEVAVKTRLFVAASVFVAPEARHQPRGRLGIRLVAGPGAPRPGVAKGADRDVDQVGPALAKLLVADAEALGNAAAEVLEQISGILGRAPDEETVEAVFARSEGNAFYVEELLASPGHGRGSCRALA